jgi:hypothetical protein
VKFRLISLIALALVSVIEQTSLGADLAATSGVVPPADELLKMRDPFKRPDYAATDDAPKAPIETFALDTMKMVAVLTGPSKLRALILGPDSKTYVVSERVKIGTRGGFVRRITTDMVEVRERIVNVLGIEENVDSEIRLVADARRLLDKNPKGNKVPPEPRGQESFKENSNQRASK